MPSAERSRSSKVARRLVGAGITTGVAGAAYSWQRAHAQRIAADPENAFLSDPAAGRPVEIHSADGTRLHAEVFGAEDAPTLVLSHGWTENLMIWAYQIRDLSSELRIVAYDLRGHGQSDRGAAGDYSPARFGDDIEAVLEATVQGDERAVIAGHSLGAMSIAAFAESHAVERRLRAAALLNTGVNRLLQDSLLIRYPQFATAAVESTSRRAFLGSRLPLPKASSPFQHAVIRYFAFGPSATPAQIAFYERMLISCPPDVRADVGLALADLDLLEALSKLTVPTLVMAGELDRLTPPAHARRIAEALPQLAGLVIDPDIAHMGPLERPHEYSAALRDLTLSTRVPAATVQA